MQAKLCPEILRKTAGEIKIYTMDFSQDMNEADTISGANVVWISAYANAPAISDISFSGQTVSFKLSGGSAGFYVMKASVTTTYGETLEGYGRLELT